MTQVQDNHFQAFCTLSQKIQKLQHQVQTSEIDEKARVSLYHELESIQDQIQKHGLSADHASQFFREFDEMHRQVISLYREVEVRFEEFEISLISKEAIKMSKAAETGRMFKVAKRVEELKHSTHFFFSHRRPSMEQRKIINLAFKLANEADFALASGGKAQGGNLSLIQTLQTLLERATEDVYISSQEGEVTMELFEIAELLEEGLVGEGRLLLQLIRNRLTKSQLRRLDAVSDAPQKMAKLLHEIACGDPCIERDEADCNEFALHSALHA